MNKRFQIRAVTIALIFTVLYVVFSPYYFKSRKRSRATKIVNDARIYEAAIDQWAKDHPGKAANEAVRSKPTSSQEHQQQP